MSVFDFIIFPSRFNCGLDSFNDGLFIGIIQISCNLCVECKSFVDLNELRRLRQQ